MHGNMNVKTTSWVLFSGLLLIAGSSRRSTQIALFVGSEMFNSEADTVGSNHKVWKVYGKVAIVYTTH